MILQNSKGKVRNFQIIFEVEKKKKKYIVYQDINTKNIYGGIVEGEKLRPLVDKEYLYLDKLVSMIME